MAGRIDLVSRPDPDAVDPRYKQKMEQKFGQQARFHWMNEQSIADSTMRGYVPVERDEDDVNQQFSPDTRVRSGDRFLAAIPEEAAQAYELEVRARRIQRLLSIQQGGQLGTEVASMIRRGLYQPKYTDHGFGGRGYMVQTDAAAKMGVDPAFAKAPWLSQGHDSQPTPHELASHIEAMHSKADLPDPGAYLQNSKVRALEAAQRWSKHTVNSVMQPGNNTLGRSLRKSGD